MTSATNVANRLVILTTSSRVPPGLLSVEAWDLIRKCGVFAADESHAQLPALRQAGVAVEVVDGVDAAQLLDAASSSTVVWLASPDGDPELADALARESARRAERGQKVPAVETITGAFDAPGARLLDLVAIMDKLRSPGGCPWDAKQTHQSLAAYLLEETYETLEAVETGDDTHLREELGDLLLQVIFHARLAQEREAGAWSIDDVAAGIVDKLIRRHPHVFGTADAVDAEHVAGRWESMKRDEKGRMSALDGVPMAQPALSLAAKLIQRADKAGLKVELPDIEVPEAGNAKDIGELLLAVVGASDSVGVDAEQALRGAIRRYAESIRAEESST